MNRQIRTCAFNAYVVNDTNTAAINGFPVNVNVFSGSYTYRPYYYTGSAYDEAINGRLRSQLGGYRFEAALSWERQLNTDPFIQLVNNSFFRSGLNTSANIVGEVIIEFMPDAANPSEKENVVIADARVTATIDGTMIRQPITLSLTGKEVKPNIPDYFML